MDELPATSRLLLLLLQKEAYPLALIRLQELSGFTPKTIRKHLQKLLSAKLICARKTKNPSERQLSFEYYLPLLDQTLSKYGNKLPLLEKKLVNCTDIDLTSYLPSKGNFYPQLDNNWSVQNMVNSQKLDNALINKGNSKIKFLPIDLGFFQGYPTGLGEAGGLSPRKKEEENNILDLSSSKVLLELTANPKSDYFKDDSRLNKSLEKFFKILLETYPEASHDEIRARQHNPDWKRIFTKFKIEILTKAVKFINQDYRRAYSYADGNAYEPFHFETLCLHLVLAQIQADNRRTGEVVTGFLVWRRYKAFKILTETQLKRHCEVEKVEWLPEMKLFEIANLETMAPL